MTRFRRVLQYRRSLVFRLAVMSLLAVGALVAIVPYPYTQLSPTALEAVSARSGRPSNSASETQSIDHISLSADAAG